MEKDLLEGFARYLDSRPAVVRQASNNGLPCITISRQMGSGGIEIAELLANRLAERSQQAWMVFDRNLAEMVWKDHNLPAPLGPFFQEEIPQAVHDAVQEILGIRMTGCAHGRAYRQPLFSGSLPSGTRSLSGEGPISLRRIKNLSCTCG